MTVRKAQPFSTRVYFRIPACWRASKKRALNPLLLPYGFLPSPPDAGIVQRPLTRVGEQTPRSIRFITDPIPKSWSSIFPFYNTAHRPFLFPWLLSNINYQEWFIEFPVHNDSRTDPNCIYCYNGTVEIWYWNKNNGVSVYIAFRLIYRVVKSNETVHKDADVYTVVRSWLVLKVCFLFIYFSFFFSLSLSI